jgi:hypothetical protein
MPLNNPVSGHSQDFKRRFIGAVLFSLMFVVAAALLATIPMFEM